MPVVTKLLTKAELHGGRALPRSVVRRVCQQAMDGLGVALCLHRVVDARRDNQIDHRSSIETDKLDDLLDLLAPTGSGVRLTLTFDDGYEDSARYIRTRAPRFPGIEWLFFICPAKTEQRVGFRWDALELENPHTTIPELVDALTEDLDIEAENHRAELRELGHLSDYRLASVAECLELQAMPNVELGNHTNCHFNLKRLSPPERAEELRRSQADFEAAFSFSPRHFAYPFGAPGLHLDEETAATVADEVPGAVQWTTEQRPYVLEDRRPGALVPRFPIDGRRGAEELALWIALRCAKIRALRRLPVGLTT